ncbi:response regulator [Pseudoroseicyclus sp. H15]
MEDEILIGMDLVMTLEEWGYVADGPHANPSDAIGAIESFAPDVAILDVNLGNGATSMPIAEKLQERGTPYLFVTGYNSARYAASSSIEAAPNLRKPVNEAQLRAKLKEILAGNNES